jgi:hypothetical protein
MTQQFCLEETRDQDQMNRHRQREPNAAIHESEVFEEKTWGRLFWNALTGADYLDSSLTPFWLTSGMHS